ncbi:MAG: MATE family efflux transporter [Sarcina sp.]
MKEKIREFFSDKKFYRTLFVLALPIIIQNLLMSSLSMADTMMVGALGDASVAAVGIGNQVNFLVQLFMFGIVGGSSIFISQFWGKKDKHNIKRTVGLSVVSSAIVGAIGTVIVLFGSSFIAKIFSNDSVVINQVVTYLKIMSFSYIVNAFTVGLAFSLRSIEDSKSPMIVSAIAVFTNIGLNYCLIFGEFGMPELGVKGAAIATVIARFLEAILLILIASRNEVFKGKFNEFFDFDMSFTKEVYKAVIPVLLNDICWGIGNFLYSVAYGQIGTEAMASVQICTNVQNIFMVLGMSMSSAALVMIGNQIGADEEKVAKDYGTKFVILSCITGIVVGISLILSSKAIVSIFNVSSEVKMYSVLILNIFSILAPIRMMNLVIIVGVLRGGGDAGYALKAEAIPMWLIGVPLAFIGALVLNLEVHYVVMLVSLEEIVKLVLSARRLKSGKWIRSLIKNIEEEKVSTSI